MKLIQCARCYEVEGLSQRPKTCGCGLSGGMYERDNLKVIVWGAARVYGLDNRVFLTGRAEVFAYPEDNGRVARLERAPAGAAQ